MRAFDSACGGTRLTRYQTIFLFAFTLTALYSYDISKFIRSRAAPSAPTDPEGHPPDLDLLRLSDSAKEDKISSPADSSSASNSYVDVISAETFSQDARDEELKLVRTSDLEYNRIVDGKRYFMYSPSGGFNNQRKELEYALKIAKLLNRR